MSTRDKIMDVALNMFSERGYEAVSIRDICGEVGIKESTLYYHFKNKEDILNSLIDKFRSHIDGLLIHVDEIAGTPGKKEKKSDDAGLQMMDSYMIDSYLFDPFCNLMLRLMMIEQFHNEEIRALYEKTLFTDPYEIQLSVFRKLSSAGAIPEKDVEWIVKEYHSYMTMLTFKYLLNGDLTEKRKNAYYREVHEFMTRRFMV
ncbi:MAG: TetR/AcrR family transcriptional regulator [Clostridiales bacterium]|jgi:AcrR family transcriptional regulator|nr:TetR/AcrR family transcriptional regulator [Clostridiales bacterium]